MQKYNVRFLKAGLIEFETNKNLPIEELIVIAKKVLDKANDQEICEAMADCVPCGNNPSRFDADSFQVEALEDPDGDYECIYMTDLWCEYAGFEDSKKQKKEKMKMLLVTNKAGKRADTTITIKTTAATKEKWEMFLFKKQYQ